MIHIISKLAPIPLYPIGLAVILCLLGLFFVIRHRRRTAIALIAAGIAQLYLFSMPATSGLLLGPLERTYPALQQSPYATAVVLLGGAGEAPMPPRIHAELSRYADRVLEAARLFRQGRCGYLICTGGVLPFVHESPFSDAATTRRVLIDDLGIDSSAILLADRSRNTHDDALDVVRVMAGLGEPYRVVLATSAFHMARSVRLFEKQGFEVFPAPSGFEEERVFQWKLIRFLPDAEALTRSCMALHEYYGMAAYRLLGWI